MVVALVLAAVVAVAAVWLSGALLQGRVRSNWASGGSTRLSPRTQALLADLPCNVTMTNLYMEESPEVPNSADLRDMRRQVQQLLQNYADANPSRITVEEVDPLVDTAGVEALVNRLRDRYKAESEKPKALIDEFLKIQADASKLMESESERLSDAADSWTGGPPAAVNALNMLAQRWAQLQQANAIKSAMVQAYVEQEGLPDYTAALSQAKTILKGLDDNFAAVPDFYAQILVAAKASPPPKDVLAILTGGKETYAPLRARIDAFNIKAADIKPLELDRITKELSQGQAILIETPTTVKVVPFEDVWRPNPAPSTAAPRRSSRSGSLPASRPSRRPCWASSRKPAPPSSSSPSPGPPPSTAARTWNWATAFAGPTSSSKTGTWHASARCPSPSTPPRSSWSSSRRRRWTPGLRCRRRRPRPTSPPSTPSRRAPRPSSSASRAA